MHPQIENIGGLVSTRRAGAANFITAGGAGDNTASTGVIIDRAALGWPQSAVFFIHFSATLAAAQSLAINGCVVQSGETAGLSDATTLATRPNEIVATSPGGGTVTGEFEIDVNLSGAGRYVRLNYTPDLSATGTDTAALSSGAVFGGQIRLPA